MEKRIVKMDLFSADPRTRALKMALDRPVQPGRIAPVVVPPDSRLLESFSSLARCAQLDIEVEIEGGKARRANLAPRYIATQVAEAETSTVEFKQSIFYAPGEPTPSGEQLKTIAQTIASFMNCQGGTLYLGVHDSGQVRRGIQDDLSLLGTGDAGIVVTTPRFTDAGHVYHGNVDSYGRKIHALVRAYLGGAAEAYLGDCVACGANGGRTYVKLEVKAAPDDVVVYYPAETRHGLVDAIFVRNGAAKKSLMGSDRDQFIRERTKRQVLANVRAVTAANPAALVDRVMAAINQAFAQGAVVTAGTEVQIEGAVALDDPHFGALGSPKGLVFDGKHVRDVKGWKGAYEALLKKLNELDAAKFDSLPQADYFRKFFVVAQPRKKYPDYFKSLLGSASNIRAKEVANKAYFINPLYVVHRLLAHFGIEPRRVGLRGGDGTVDVRKETAPVCETVAPTPTPQSAPSDLVHAFTVKPMMGWLIMNGVKDVENRSKGVNPPKGTCAVSYSKGYTPDEYESDIAYLRDEIGLGERKIKSLPSYEELKPFCGKIVGVVDYEVAEESSSRWYHLGCKAWKMSKPRQIANPFPVTGFVNMWNLKPADAKKILKQL